MSAEITSRIQKQIEELEAERYRAMAANDFETLERMLGDELVYIHSSAVADTKKEYIDSLRSGDLRYHSFRTADVRIQIFGENTAAIFGHIWIEIDLHGQPKSLENLYTNLWVRDDGGPWRFVSWQSTPFPKPVS